MKGELDSDTGNGEQILSTRSQTWENGCAATEPFLCALLTEEARACKGFARSSRGVETSGGFEQRRFGSLSPL